MSRDTLFLLPPGIQEKGQRQYCPECAEIWGVLAYYPALRETLNVVYQPLTHPRPQIVDLLGDGRWNCPTLVLAEESPDGPDVKGSENVRYIDSARGIGRYWAQLYGTAIPR